MYTEAQKMKLLSRLMQDDGITMHMISGRFRTTVNFGVFFVFDLSFEICLLCFFDHFLGFLILYEGQGLDERLVHIS